MPQRLDNAKYDARSVGTGRGARARRTTARGPFAPRVLELERRELMTLQPTVTTIGVSTLTPTLGQSETFTAHVSLQPPSAGTVTGGTVTFQDFGVTLGTAPLVAGSAQLTTSILGLQGHSVTAAYSGDGVQYAPSAVVTITTFAGNGTADFGGDGGPAVSAMINHPEGIAIDSAGNLYVADQQNNRVREVNAQSGIITTIAGNGTAGYSGDGGSPTAAELNGPSAVAVDSSGNIFIADTGNKVVREIVAATGNIITVAGGGTGGVGNNGPATSATLVDPVGLAVDTSGHFFIADDQDNRIREVNETTGIITTVAGNGTAGFSGDGGPAASAQLSAPHGVAVDASGNLFIADTNNSRIRRVDALTGNITTVVGSAASGYNGDNIPVVGARLNFPLGVAVDAGDNLFIADSKNNRVREVLAWTGQITTVAGTGTPGFSGDGGLAAAAHIAGPDAIAIDPAGNLYTAEVNNARVRRFSLPAVPTVALGTAVPTLTTIVASAGHAVVGQPVTYTATVTAGPPSTATPTGSVTFFDGSTSLGTVTLVGGVATLPAQKLGVGNHVVTASYGGVAGSFVPSAAGSIATIAGNGTGDFSGDGGPAVNASIFGPTGLVVDPSGNVFFCDTLNNRIREVVKATGQIITVAGNGTLGYGGDGGPATAAELGNPKGLAIDSAGNLFIADFNNHRIREVIKATGQIITVAGNGTAGSTGDGGPATAAELNSPEGVAVDSAGNLYIADTNNRRVREVVKATGNIVASAGSGTAGSSGDGGPATAAQFLAPVSLSLDAAGDLYIVDQLDSRVRRIDASTGIITTVAGSSTRGFSGDGGPATAAQLFFPTGVAVDSSGNLFIGDSSNNRVREVASTTGLISTIAGNGSALFSGDGGPAVFGGVRGAGGLAVDAWGNLDISDGNDHIRQMTLPANATVTPAVTTTTVSASPNPSTYGQSVRFTAVVKANAPSTATPTGSVQFQIDGSSFGSPVTLVMGTASSPPIASLTAGAHTVTVLYVNSDGNFVSGSGTLAGGQTVTQAPLTITADDKTKGYGAPLPALTASYSGFVNGDTSASLTTPPTLSTTATASSAVGTYAITASGAVDPNYAITYIAGTLSISPAALTITADDKFKAYGAARPVLTASYSGFVNGDTPASLTTAPTLTTTATASSHVGNYPITAAGAVDSNYTISYVAGTLSITPASLTITADSKTKLLGAPLPPLTASYSGFVNGDTPASLTTPAVLSTPATASSPLGVQPITVSGASDPDYNITMVAGTLTILRPLIGDYTGDGKTDLALFYRTPNSSQGTWLIANVTPPSGTPFGAAHLDVPIQGDFNGDGKTDIAVYRPSTAQWFIGGQPSVTFGAKNVDIPVPGDYDGVGHTELAVYRPTTGQWFVAGDAKPISFGGPGDIPVPGDYDGVGHTEFAVYRPKTGQWFIAGHAQPVSFGGPNDIPVPGYYNNMSHEEFAVYRPATAQWFIAGHPPVSFGAKNVDIPVPGDYDGVGHTQIAVFRPTTGDWYIAGHATPIPYGGPHDVPAGAPYAYRSIGGSLSIKQVAAPTSTGSPRLSAAAVVPSTVGRAGSRPVVTAAITPTGPLGLAALRRRPFAFQAAGVTR